MFEDDVQRCEVCNAEVDKLWECPLCHRFICMKCSAIIGGMVRCRDTNCCQLKCKDAENVTER